MNFMTLQLNKLQTKKNQHHLVDGILTAVIIQNLLIQIISEIIIRINYQLLSNAQIAEKNKKLGLQKLGLQKCTKSYRGQA